MQGGGIETVTLLELTFLVVAALEVGTSVILVTARKLTWAAFELALTLVTLAGLFLILQSEFVAIIQILVYAGAVPVLLLFGIMLTQTRVLGEVP